MGARQFSGVGRRPGRGDWWILNLSADPVPQDVGVLAGMAERYRRFADECGRAASGVTVLINDPAVQGWMGKSGQAFKDASEPFPSMLQLAKSAYLEVGDAYSTLSVRLGGAQGGLDRLCAQALQHYSDAMTFAGVPDGVLRAALAAPNADGALKQLAANSPVAADSLLRSFLVDPLQGIYSCRSQVDGLVGEAHQANRDFVTRVDDATALAARILRRLGGSGKDSLDFATRFAALGGNTADLRLNAHAGADVLGFDGAPGLDPSVPVAGAVTPAAVAAWWGALTPDQQQVLIDQHPDQIGSLDGVPCDARDKANRELLDLRIAQLESDGSNDGQLGVLKNLRDKMNQGGQRVFKTDNHAQWNADTPQFDSPMPPLYLLHFDTDGNGHLIMAAGNPDTSANVVTYVPGLGTRLSDHMVNNDIAHTENLYLQAKEGHPDASVSSVFWLGYDAPQIDGGSDGWWHAADVTSNDNADAGAPKLTAFLNGLHATSTATGPVHYTALGHSYGSLVVGTAAAQPGGIPVQDIVFAGSPGVGVDHAGALGLGPEHVWAGSAANDPVPRLQTTADTLGGAAAGGALGGPLGALLGAGAGEGASQLGMDDNGGWFGMNPATSDFHGQVFPVAPGDTGGFPSGMDAHGEYFDPAQRPGSQSSGESLQNMANIVVGDYDHVHVIVPPQDPHKIIDLPGPPPSLSHPPAQSPVV